MKEDVSMITGIRLKDIIKSDGIVYKKISEAINPDLHDQQDSITVSNAAVQLRDLLSDPDNKTNLYRIEQLKADIKNGNYQIDFENLSKKMLELNEGLQVEGT